MNISIVSGWLPVVVECVAVVGLVLAIDWRGGGWRRQLAIGIPVAVLVSGVTGAILWLASLVSGGTPWWPLAWGAMLVLAVVVAVLGWSAAGLARRVASVVAVLLMILTTLSAVNVRTGTFPTVDW